MRLFYKIPFYFLLTAIIIAGSFINDAHAQLLKKNKKKDKKETTASLAASDRTDEVRKIEGVFIEANKFKLIGDIESAQSKFEEVLKLDPNNDAALYELGKIYYQNADAEKSFELAKKAYSIDDNNKWYAILFAEVAAHLGNYGDAGKVYQNPESNLIKSI